MCVRMLLTHALACTQFYEKVAYAAIQTVRWGFDKASGYRYDSLA